jgi:AcrR family transcriptional regulator
LSIYEELWVMGLPSVGGDAGGGCEGHSMRADARRNRAQILQAAETAFAEEGVGVPIDEIAQRACVGVGTVYRHFPTKEALFEAVIVTRMQALAEEAKALSDAEDPADALFGFLTRLATQACSKRDLVDALSGAGIEIKEASKAFKDDLESAMSVLLQRAQAAGDVRTDIQLEDIFGLVMGTCTLQHHEPACNQERMLSVVCDGLRTHNSHRRTASIS